MRGIGLWVGAIACAVGFAGCSGARGADAVTPTSGEVLLVPEVSAGQAGWCMVRVSATEAGCAVARSHRGILAESWVSDGPGSPATGYALTASSVHTVGVGELTGIATHREAALPDSLRAVVVELPQAPSAMRFVAEGDTTPSREDRNGPLQVTVPSESVTSARQSHRGVCGLTATSLPGLVAKGGTVVTRVKPLHGLAGTGFLSCVSMSYDLDGWPLVGAVLLAAGDPGSAPPMLPAMRPVPRRANTFTAPGAERPGAEGELLASRIRGAWLVVSGGQLAQRLTLLSHLRATIGI
jgi:hypothetical protein